ncbi:MAG TPA: hypothetical protein VIT91_07595 [Chthoniobacterales bacterium]
MSWFNRLVQRWWPPSLHRKIDEQARLIRNCCDEWADDHTHLQALCLKAGCHEDQVSGDSHHVPGIQELADMLADKTTLKD